MVVQSGNDEFHGVDTRGGGINGHHAIGIDADVGGWDPENIQSWIDDFFGTYVSSLGHVAVIFFNVFSSSVPVVPEDYDVDEDENDDAAADDYNDDENDAVADDD